MKFNLNQRITDDVSEWLDRFVQAVRVEMHNKNLDASGNLSDSLTWKIEQASDGLHAVVEADSYFLYAEKGRAAGKVPWNFANIIAQWAEDKGVQIPSKFKTPVQFGWAVASKIRRFGSRRYRENDPLDVVGEVLDVERPKLNDIVNNVVVLYVNDNLF